MRSLLYHINDYGPEDLPLFESLTSHLEGEAAHEQLNFCLTTFKSTGAFPTRDILNQEFNLNLTLEDKVFDSYKHLRLIHSRASQVKYRKCLMDLSAKDNISVQNILTIADECSASDTCTIDTVDDTLSMADIYNNIKSRPVGCKFFVGPLDDEVYGVAYKTVCTIFGFVSHMKTTLLYSILYGNAKDHGYNSALISLEGAKEDSYMKLLSRHSYTLRPDAPLTYKDIRKGLLTDEDAEFLLHVEEDYKNMDGKIFILDGHDIIENNQVSPYSITRALEKRHKICTLDCLGVDYMQLFKHFRMDGATNPTERMTAAVEMFSQLAIHFGEHGLITFLLSQANRDGWMRASRNNGTYTLTSLAEINTLERASEYVVSVFSDESLAASQEMSIQLLKHRGGEKLETPFTTYADPSCGLIGDIEGYGQTFSEDVLDDTLDGLADF